MSEKPCLIILNGTSSAGKTSTAKEMQKLDDSFMHLQMDMFWNMAPAHVEADSKRYPKLKFVMMDTVKSLLNYGHNVIFDTVAFGEQVGMLRDNFKSFDPFIAVLKAEQKTNQADEVLLKDLISTFHYDSIIVSEAKNVIDKSRNLKAEVLLLGGSKSQRSLKCALH